ncbi:MAG: hypothetical protein H7336_12550 [Bacteriovorax sp.]|nr:hypothetical protein [Bacteriovorax sp.]
MKILMLSLVLTLSTLQSAFALDQAGIDQLKKQGFEVRMGELTGAGSRLSLSHLAGFIHPNGIVMKQDCKSIAVAQSSDKVDPKISDVTKVVVDQSVIQASEFEGFFTFQ